MAYEITCPRCRHSTWARNIVDLIEKHTNEAGRLVCETCKQPNAYIYRSSKLQEQGQTWDRWIKGVIRIETLVPTYSPYVFLTADGPQGSESEVNGIHFNYYKDTRADGGALKHGHGPGGAPVLSPGELLALVKALTASGIYSVNELKALVTESQRVVASAT